MPKTAESMTFEELRAEIEDVRTRVNEMRKRLARYFVGKSELIDLMCTALVAQEPFLLVGPPGTAKSELVTKFCQALGLGDGEYFEYMLTKFTEPSELLSLTIFLIVAIVTSALAGRIRDQARAANERMVATRRLYEFTWKLSGLTDIAASSSAATTSRVALSSGAATLSSFDRPAIKSRIALRPALIC